MSIEEEVRKKHEFEDKQYELLKFASWLSLRELEIVLAKLADKLSNESDEKEIENLNIKGEILKQFYKLRTANPKNEKKYKKPWKYEIDEIYRGIINLRFIKNLKKTNNTSTPTESDTSIPTSVIVGTIIVVFLVIFMFFIVASV